MTETSKKKMERAAALKRANPKVTRDFIQSVLQKEFGEALGADKLSRVLREFKKSAATETETKHRPPFAKYAASLENKPEEPAVPDKSLATNLAAILRVIPALKSAGVAALVMSDGQRVPL